MEAVNNDEVSSVNFSWALTFAPVSSLDPTSSTSSTSTSSANNVSLLSSGGSIKEGLLLRDARITLYVLIFLLSVVGNSLVIVTLIQNKRMRTVTNVFLLNLAVSDLLLGMFCMPFTLVGSLLREFIFGEAMCKTISYIQAVSVSVSVWTLVAISLERFFAICQPLRSRRWQTLSHAYRMIGAVWLGSFVYMIPIVSLSQLQPLRVSGRYKCRENWPDEVLEKVFNILLDVLLLVLPLIIMIAAYSRITRCLTRSLQIEKQNQNASTSTSQPTTTTTTTQQQSSSDNQNPQHYITVSSPHKKKPRVYSFRTTANNTPTRLNLLPPTESNGRTTTTTTTTMLKISPLNEEQQQDSSSSSTLNLNQKATSLNSMPSDCSTSTDSVEKLGLRPRPPIRHLRSTNFDKSTAAKKHVIKMLFILVLEFFVCWTPLYVINTVTLFDPSLVYSSVGATGISFFHLLAYSSSCCNPITYCFMNRKFRQAFLQAFGCGRRCSTAAGGGRGTFHSSTNGMSFYNRQSTIRTGKKLQQSPLISPV